MFQRVLAEQVADVRRLQDRFPKALVLWAGDFNQTLRGLNHGGSKLRRGLLEDALTGVGMTAWNREARHDKPDMRAIDLICGPTGRPPSGSVEVIEPHAGTSRLFDHVGYLLEFRSRGGVVRAGDVVGAVDAAFTDPLVPA